MPIELDDKQIELYLLGALPDAEIERLDELSVTDDSFAERLGVVENDLVDAYAREELSADLLQRFNSHYLASARRRDKVRFAGALLEFGAAAAPSVAKDELTSAPNLRVRDEPPIPHSGWMSFLAAPRLGWAIAGAGLLVLVAAAYLAVENLRLRSEIAQAQHERAAPSERERELERQIEDERSEGTKTADELASVRERLAQLEQQSTGGHVKPDGDGGGLPVLAFTLAAPTRGGGTVRTLALPARDVVVVLELQLESDDFPDYRAALKSAATNQVMWQRARLKPAHPGQAKAISIRLRAGLLKPGTYNLELAGIQKGGNPEIVGTYPFRVVIQ